MSQSRQLAAIMFTDIVGYTALMGKDSDKAMELVDVNKKIQKPLVEKHHGKWLKEMGDGAMAQFSSALDAVNCALEIQENAGKKLDAKLRIGINLGDVQLENNDVYGDGVNVAARLESITDPGGIYISESIEKAIRGQTKVQVKYLGEIQLKNVDYGVRTYALQGAGLPVPDLKGKKLAGGLIGQLKQPGAARVRIISMLLGLLLIAIVGLLAYNKYWDHTGNDASNMEKSIAVLPLLNLNSKDENLEYFSDGITQEIIYELAKIKSISVTAFTTSIAYKKSDKPPNEIAKELDVGYIVSGSSRILNNGSRVKIVLELFDPLSNKIIWTETFNEDFDDVTTIQSNAVKDIAIELNVDQTSLAEAYFNNINTESGEAFRLFLQAKSEIYKMTPEGFENTRVLLTKALEIDPNYAQAHTLMAWNLILQGGSWFQANNRTTAETEALALPHINKSIELNPESSDIYLIRGNLNLHHRSLLRDAKSDVDNALKINSWPRVPTDYCICTVVATYSSLGEIERAKSLAILGAKVDPGNVFISFDRALIGMLEGRMKEAQSLLETTVEIVDIPFFNFYLGWSYYHDNQYEKALAAFKKTYEFDDWSIAFNVAYLSNTYLKIGNQQQSEEYLKELLDREQSGEKHVNLSLAMIYAARNDADKTLEYLEIAYSNREYAFAYMINTDLIFRPYYEEPRFIELRKKVQFYQ